MTLQTYAGRSFLAHREQICFFWWYLSLNFQILKVPYWLLCHMPRQTKFRFITFCSSFYHFLCLKFCSRDTLGLNILLRTFVAPWSEVFFSQQVFITSSLSFLQDLSSSFHFWYGDRKVVALKFNILQGCLSPKFQADIRCGPLLLRV